MRNTSELARARRRIRQLEKCLRDVVHLLFDRAVELNAAGRDDEENAEYRSIQTINTRIRRTLPDG
jgi:hypothetical protein